MFPNQLRAVRRVEGALRRGDSVYLHGDPGTGVTTVLRAAVERVPDVHVGTVDLALATDEPQMWERMFAGVRRHPELGEFFRAAATDGWSSDGVEDLVYAAQRRGDVILASCEHFDRILERPWALGALVKLRRLGQVPRQGGRSPFVLVVGAAVRPIAFNEVYARATGDRRSPFNHLLVEEIDPLTSAEVPEDLRCLVPYAGFNPRLIEFARAYIDGEFEERRARTFLAAAGQVLADVWEHASDGEREMLDVCLLGAVARGRGRALPSAVLDWVEERAALWDGLVLRGLLERVDGRVVPAGAVHVWWFIDRRFPSLAASRAPGPAGRAWADLVRETVGPQPTIREALSWIG